MASSCASVAPLSIKTLSMSLGIRAEAGDVQPAVRAEREPLGAMQIHHFSRLVNTIAIVGGEDARRAGPKVVLHDMAGSQVRGVEDRDIQLVVRSKHDAGGLNWPGIPAGGVDIARNWPVELS